MADYHTQYVGPEGETTEWDDLQRKYGNLPPKEKPKKPDPYVPEKELTSKEKIEQADEQGLLEQEDDYDDDRELEKLRLQRMKQLKQHASRPKFGSVQQIRGSDFVQAVTEASASCWVAVAMVKEGQIESGLVLDAWQTLADQYPNTKFVSGQAQDLIPRYPDANVPTVLLYRNKICEKNIVGINQLGGRKTNPDVIALLLNKHAPICVKNGDEDGDDSKTTEQKQKQSEQQHIEAMLQRIVQTREDDDEDSDFG